MINPWNILAITFTNKAAREMRERAMALNPATSETLIATFHSMCVRILRREAGPYWLQPKLYYRRSW